MGTIVERDRKDGSTAYMARIVINRDGAVYYRETETFDRRPAAVSWIKTREDELAKPGVIEAIKAKETSEDPTLGDAIDKFTADTEKEIGKTQAHVLRSIKGQPIARMKCSEVKTPDITTLVKSWDVSPSTRANYLSHLSSVFTVAKPMWGYPLDAAEIAAAFVVLKKLGIISQSNQRDRRPTLEELDKLMAHYQRSEKLRPKRVKMTRLIAFAIFSTRRQDEICRIAWPDFEPEHKRVMVRDMKDPDQKAGNDVWCDLPPEAQLIIEATPKTGEKIFKASARSVSTEFARTCMLLGIENLHFHDLRHDGISRLFEMGYGGGSIPHVAAVSGHRSWSSLQRYTHIRQRGDKYANWKWLDYVTSQP